MFFVGLERCVGGEEYLILLRGSEFTSRDSHPADCPQLPVTPAAGAPMPFPCMGQDLFCCCSQHLHISYSYPLKYQTSCPETHPRPSHFWGVLSLRGNVSGKRVSDLIASFYTGDKFCSDLGFLLCILKSLRSSFSPTGNSGQGERPPGLCVLEGVV